MRRQLGHWRGAPFSEGDYERCVKYTATLLAGTTPRPNDYINAGHLSLLTGHPGEAVDHYVDAIKAMEGNVDSFLRRLADDKVTISAFGGVDPQLMAIVVDTSIAKSK